MGFPLWKEWVLASNNDPKRDAVEIFWAMTTSLEHVLRLLRWFLWRWNTLSFGVVVKKKSVTIFCSQCSYVTFCGKKRSPWSLQICSQGWRWVKSEKDRGSFSSTHVYSQAGYHQHDDRVACGEDPAPLTCPLQGEQGTGSAGLREGALFLLEMLAVLEQLTSPPRPYSCWEAPSPLRHPYSCWEAPSIE